MTKRRIPPFNIKSSLTVGRLALAIMLAIQLTLFSACSEDKPKTGKYKMVEADVGEGFMEKTEVKPLARLPISNWQLVSHGTLTLSQTAERVRRSSYLADAHWNLKITVFMPAGSLAGLTLAERFAKAASFGKARWEEPGAWRSAQPMPGSEYARRTCEECHRNQTRDIHITRVKNTCRQCHGPEPISGGKHYYSIMHESRRHIFVCSKCHENASDSFAKYVVHEPSPVRLDTREYFPVLFYVFWLMMAIAVGTFAVFLPHTFLWGVRELFMKKGGHDSDG